MRVTYVAAGAAGMICGSCLRDNALALELRRLGCEVTFVPVYTPITTDAEDASDDALLFGGVSVFLEQKSALFRRMPKWLLRWLDRPSLVRRLTAKRSLEVEAKALGELTLSMLRGEHGNQRAEVERAVGWMRDVAKPELLNLTNLLIAGFVPALKAELDVPVLATLQGDDLFLDELTDEHRPLVLAELRRLAREVDGFVTFSAAYADSMSELLEVPREKFHLAPLGIDARDFASLTRRPNRPPTIGYFGRICPEKGFGLAVDAFLALHRGGEAPTGLRLRAGGWLGEGDRAFFAKQEAKLGDAGLADRFEYIGAPDREGKLAFFRDIDVFTLPTTYREPKGLSVLEALAAGVPVVQPDHGAFPALLGEVGGGILFPAGSVTELAEALGELIADPARAGKLGAEGRRGVVEQRSDRRMAERTLAIYQQFR